VDIETRYKLLEKIGAGSFATVYRARDTELGREVAVKQIHAQYLQEPDQLARYWQEAQLLASLQHPNIVTIFDIYRERGWLIMELMQTNLATRMAGRQMDLRSLRSTIAHCLRALKYLHERGIVHGDIKPSNMMIDARRRVKLADFGLARRVSDEDGSLLKGTTKYMAPEVVSDEFGEVGPASDLYSLGFAAYDLMCGPNFESLFPGLGAYGRNKQIAWMMWHAAADRKLPEITRVLEGVPDDLSKVVQKLCEKDQSRRYASADEALADLNVDLKTVSAARTDAGDVVDAESSDAEDGSLRKRRLMLGGALVVSVMLSLAMLFLPGGGSGNSKQPREMVRVVSEVLADRGILKVEDLERTFAEDVPVGKRPRITLTNTGRNIVLREIRPGDRVRIEQITDDDGRPVTKLTVSRPVRSRGKIRSMDATDRRIVIAVTDGKNRDDLSLRIPEGAEVLINGKPGRMLDLRKGDPVDVWHLDGVGEQTGRVVWKLSAGHLGESVGFVSQIDAGRNHLTVRFGRGPLAGRLSLPLATDCRITLRGRNGKPDSSIQPTDLKPDDMIRFHYDDRFRDIVVTRDARRLSGVVKDVRPAQRELIVSTSDGNATTFQLSPTAEVMLSFEDVSLADLRKYDKVEISYNDAKSGRPAASTVFATRGTQPDRWAIVIGPERYKQKSLRLPFSGRDAILFRDTLLSRYAFRTDNVLLLQSERAAQMQQRIGKLLKNIRYDQQLIVYVVGHAFRGSDGKSYVAGEHFSSDRITETGLSFDWLAEQIETCSARDKMLLLDCTHPRRSGGTAEPSPEEMIAGLKRPLKTTYVIGGIRKGQQSLNLPDKQRGLFAAALSDGFAGRADSNRDLRITAIELFAYLQQAMKSITVAGQRQSPVLLPPR